MGLSQSCHVAETGEGAFQQMWADHQAKEQKGPKDRDLWGLQPVTADSWYLSAGTYMFLGARKRPQVHEPQTSAFKSAECLVTKGDEDPELESSKCQPPRNQHKARHPPPFWFPKAL